MSLGETVKLILDLIAFPQPENSYGFEVNSQKLNTKQDESFHESVIFISALEHWATILPENVNYSVILPY